MQTDSETRRAVLPTPADLSAMMASEAPPLVVAVQSVNIYTGQDSRAAKVWLPGAVDAEVFADFAAPASPAEGHRPLPAIAELQATARRLGITRDRSVVLYDADRSMTAARAWWVLRWGGVPDVRVLDGGLTAWRTAGLPMTDAPARPVPSGIGLEGGKMPQFGVGGALALAQDGVLLDARIRPNYIGGSEDGDPRRGHIPGAVCAPTLDTMTDHGEFTDSETLAGMFLGHGVTGDRPVGVYCGAGMSAAHSVLALAAIGVTASMYPGSWSQWVHDPARPTRRGPFP